MGYRNEVLALQERRRRLVAERESLIATLSTMPGLKKRISVLKREIKKVARGRRRRIVLANREQVGLFLGLLNQRYRENRAYAALAALSIVTAAIVGHAMSHSGEELIDECRCHKTTSAF